MPLPFERDDPARSDERIERQLIDRVPALDEVERRIDVCPGVITEGDDRDVVRVAMRDPLQWLHSRGSVSPPSPPVGSGDDGDLTDCHGASRVTCITPEQT